VGSHRELFSRTNEGVIQPETNWRSGKGSPTGTSSRDSSRRLFSHGFEMEDIADVRHAKSIETLFDLPDALEHDAPIARLHFVPGMKDSGVDVK
jgi:hypothetical protein